MADKEDGLLKRLMIDWTAGGGRLFRNNVGTGWAGNAVRVPEGVLIHGARRFRAGLCVGSSDLIGWTPTKITGDMVGQTVAIFTAVEAKTGRVGVSDEQMQFIEAVRSAGGIGMVVRGTGQEYEIE